MKPSLMRFFKNECLRDKVVAMFVPSNEKSVSGRLGSGNPIQPPARGFSTSSRYLNEQYCT